MGRPHMLWSRSQLSAGLSAMVSASVLLASANVSLPVEHQALPVTSCCAPVKTVTIEPSLDDYIKLASLELNLVSVPGTGNSHDPADAAGGYKWLDSGIYDAIGNKYSLLDPTLYPAVLGTGSPTGQQSVDTGAKSVVTIMLVDRQGNPNVVHLLVGGSQGAMVIQKALFILGQAGYSLDNVYAVLYSNPYRAGTGFVTRFAPGSWTLNTGLDPGVPSLPSDVPIVDVGHEYDVMVRSPKYWYNALAWANALLGFIVEHGDLGAIDYNDPLNKVVVDGNVTMITLHSQFLPLMMPIVALVHAAGLPTDLLKPLDTVLRGLIDPDLEETGTYQFVPDLSGIIYRIQRFGQSVVEALQQVVQLVQGQPLSPPETAGESPTQQIIDEATAKAEQNNGTLTTTNRVTTASVVATMTTETPAPAEQSAPSVTPLEAPAPSQAQEPTAASVASSMSSAEEAPSVSASGTGLSTPVKSTSTARSDQPDSLKDKVTADDSSESTRTATSGSSTGGSSTGSQSQSTQSSSLTESHPSMSTGSDSTSKPAKDVTSSSASSSRSSASAGSSGSSSNSDSSGSGSS